MRYAFITVLATIVWFSAATAAEVTLQNAFPNLLPPAFNYPTNLQDPRDGTDRLFVTEQEGKIWVFQNDPSVVTRTLFLDLTPQVNNTWECGLLGLAFHPNYENNGIFYVYYTTSGALTSRLSRFHVSANPNLADLGSEEPLIEIPQTNFCHKAGCLEFGRDGYLYMTVGDDCQGWPGQALTSLMGKLLRIDVDSPSTGPYAIPPGNPFVGNTNGWREEIYAYGFRNPWRFSIDPETKRIWLGDVGELTWEEVNVVKKGRNYGWIKMEGSSCYPSPAACDTLGMNAVAPVWTYPHMSEYGESVTGGYVYRGHTAPSLWGKYIYADYPTGTIWALSYDGVNASNDEIYSVQPTKFISSFGVDKDDELYVVSLWGHIYRMIDITTGIDGRTPAAPQLTAEPNPFGSSTTLHFAGSLSPDARIQVFDVRGRPVRSLAVSTGGDTGSVTWDGRDDANRELASGVYFARLSMNGRVVANQRVVLVR